MGLRVGQGRQQLLRVRHRQRPRVHGRLSGDQAPDLRSRRPAVADRRPRRRRHALRQGARRRARPGRRVPAGLRRQHLGDELRLAVRGGRRGAQPGRGAGRLPAEHGGGRAVGAPPARRRTDLPDRHRLLRMPRRAGPVRPAAPQGPGGRRARAGPGDQAQPGCEAGARGSAARRQGLGRDRGGPGRAAGRGLREPLPARRVQRRRQPARLGGAAGRRDRAAGRHQVRRRRPRVLAGAHRRHGRHRPGRGLRDDRRRRGRHGRRAADLHRLGVAALPARVLTRLRGVRPPGPAGRRRLHRRRQARPARQRRRRLRAGVRHGQRRPRGDAVHRLHPGAEVPHRHLPDRRRDPERVAVARAGPGAEVGPGRQLREDAAPRPAEGRRGVRPRAPRADRGRLRGGAHRADGVVAAGRGVRLRAGLGPALGRRSGRDRADHGGGGGAGRHRAAVPDAVG